MIPYDMVTDRGLRDGSVGPSYVWWINQHLASINVAYYRGQSDQDTHGVLRAIGHTKLPLICDEVVIPLQLIY